MYEHLVYSYMILHVLKHKTTKYHLMCLINLLIGKKNEKLFKLSNSKNISLLHNQNSIA